MSDLGISAENFSPTILYVTRQKSFNESKVAQHSHDFISLICVLSGSCTHDIDGQSYKVKKGNVVICNPGVQHGKSLLPGEEIVEFHVGFSDIFIKNLPKNHLIPSGICPIINLGRYEADFYRCCNEILLEQERNEPGLDLIIKSLVMKLVFLLLKAFKVEPFYDSVSSRDNLPSVFEPSDRVNIVNSIVAYINENYMKEISLEKISKNTYLSPVYISKIFKEETGDSPINYLIKTRLAKATVLLEEGNLSIKAASKSVGYHDAYYFSKLFKKYYGFPPSKIGRQ